ncbi:hypothetical protein HBI47_070850 [Parastagonospora nodorum]|nr:hypothetical protein HBI47_070850 [Parastagonospora nodorum]
MSLSLVRVRGVVVSRCCGVGETRTAKSNMRAAPVRSRPPQRQYLWNHNISSSLSLRHVDRCIRSCCSHTQGKVQPYDRSLGHPQSFFQQRPLSSTYIMDFKLRGGAREL